MPFLFLPLFLFFLSMPTQAATFGIPALPREAAATNGVMEAIGGIATEEAVGLLGIRYKWGGETPDDGFDCSGFVQHVFDSSLGIKLPRTSFLIQRDTVRIRQSELAPGDLVFFNTRGAKYSHVGIYLGDDKFVHAPRTGGNVSVSDLSDGYWTSRFDGARRVPGAKPGFLFRGGADRGITTEYMRNASSHVARDIGPETYFLLRETMADSILTPAIPRQTFRLPPH